jgi:hypothetical protein
MFGMNAALLTAVHFLTDNLGVLLCGNQTELGLYRAHRGRVHNRRIGHVITGRIAKVLNESYT